RAPARRSATFASATRPARSSSRCASATARSTRRPSPTSSSRRATFSSASARPTSCSDSKICSDRRGPLPADPAHPLAEALGPDVELERPSESAHGDYATNAALRLAGTQRKAPREIAAELVAVAESLPHVDRAEIAGPGFVNLFLSDAWFADALREVL